jgi:hypothetical protein
MNFETLLVPAGLELVLTMISTICDFDLNSLIDIPNFLHLKLNFTIENSEMLANGIDLLGEALLCLFA